MKKKCECCGYYTIPGSAEEVISFICPVCFWEVDSFIRSEDEPSDQNHQLTLIEARENFRNLGACHEKFTKKVRDPYKQERHEMK